MAFFSPYAMQTGDVTGQNPPARDDWSAWRRVDIRGGPYGPPPPIPTERQRQQQLSQDLWEDIQRARERLEQAGDDDEIYASMLSNYNKLLSARQAVNRSLGAENKENMPWAPAMAIPPGGGPPVHVGYTDPISGTLLKLEDVPGARNPAQYNLVEMAPGEHFLISQTNPNAAPIRVGAGVVSADTSAQIASRRESEAAAAALANQRDATDRATLEYNNRALSLKNENDKRELEVAAGRLTQQAADRQQRVDEANLVDARVRMQETIRFMDTTQRANWENQLKQENYDKDVWQTIQGAIVSANRDASAEERDAYQGQVSQATGRQNVAMNLALKAADMYTKNFEGQLEIGTDWMDAFQKGAMAIAAGRTLPANWLQGLTQGWPTKPQMDPTYGRREFANMMGTTYEQPFPATVDFSRGPRQALTPPPQRNPLAPALITPEQVGRMAGTGDYLTPPGAGAEIPEPIAPTGLPDIGGSNYLEAMAQGGFTSPGTYPGINPIPGQSQIMTAGQALGEEEVPWQPTGGGDTWRGIPVNYGIPPLGGEEDQGGGRQAFDWGNMGEAGGGFQAPFDEQTDAIGRMAEPLLQRMMDEMPPDQFQEVMPRLLYTWQALAQSPPDVEPNDVKHATWDDSGFDLPDWPSLDDYLSGLETNQQEDYNDPYSYDMTDFSYG